jgi:hypothetical protein
MIGLLGMQKDRAMIPRALPFATEEILVANNRNPWAFIIAEAAAFSVQGRCRCTLMRSKWGSDVPGK